MDRRESLKSMTLAGLASPTLLNQLGSEQPGRTYTAGRGPDGPPNIVLFIADDLGTYDIEPYGNAVVRTPNLSRLADQGMRFTNAFSASPTCTPSRSAMYTGLMPFRNAPTPIIPK